jgi:spore coat protein CotH
MVKTWFLVSCVGALTACNEPTGRERRPLDGDPLAHLVEELPLLWIEVTAEIPQEPKVACTVRLRAPANAVPGLDFFLPCGIERRGRSADSFDKRSYNLELRDGEGDELAVGVLGMPANADWAVNAVYLDPSLFRHRLSYDLFRRAGRFAPESRFVDLYLNGEYRGVYLLTDKVNRESMALSPWAGERSALYKAYAHSANFEATAYGRAKSVWHEGYELKYPRDLSDAETEPTAWAPLDALVELCATAPDEEFDASIDSQIDVGTFLDWHLLLLLTCNGDGATKNYYLARDRIGTVPVPFTVVPWDYDATFGQNWNTAPGPLGGWITNRLITRLLGRTEVRQRWCDRYVELSTTVWSVSSQLELVDDYLVELGDAPSRNFDLWPLDAPAYLRELTFDGEVATVRTWIEAHAEWLDAEVASHCE